MDSFTEKKVNMDSNDYDIKVIKESDTSSNDDDSDNNSTHIVQEGGESNIGLDLLVNSNKMINSNVEEENKNHKEIDLIKNDIDEEESPVEKKQHNSDNDDDSDDSDEDDSDDSDNKNSNTNYNYTAREPEPSLDDIIEEKKKLLYEFERFRKRGYNFSKQFSLASSLEEMKYELEKVKKQREIENSVAFSKKMLMAFVTALEFLNNRFDPFELKLDGWSENVHENIGEYDDIFEELHEKYKSTGKVSPEIKLLLTLGGSAFMFHLTNNIFKSAMPQFENALGNNPDILNNMMNKNNSNNPPMNNGGGGNGGGGGGFDIGSLLGMMSGMGGGGGGMPNLGAMGGGMPNMEAMGGGMPNMGAMGGGMPNLDENTVKKKNKTMEGPQGLDTLLESLSTNNNNNNKTVNTKKKKKKGLDL